MDEFLATITKEVFKRRPVLAEIAQSYSKQPVLDYVKKSWLLPNVPADAGFVDVVNAELENLYGQGIAEAVLGQLKKKPLVSTISHMGIWGHPIFVNADLIYSLHFAAKEFAVALATESVSLNNTSSWSGSVLYHQGTNIKRVSFFPDRQKTLPVFSAPAIGTKDIARFNKRLGEQANGLVDILKLPESKNFSEQCCKATAGLWQAVFPSAPKLLYLPLETIILKYLLRAFKDQSNIFSKIILTSDGQKLWKNFFPDEHTFIFWAIEENGRRKSLSKLPEENELINLMQSRGVYPSSPLCFAVLLYAGLACVGGFNQTTLLSQTKEKFLRLLLELEETSLIEKITSVPTKNFAESSLARLNISGNYLVPTALDLLLTDKDYYPVYKQLAEKLTLGQSLNLAMPEIYSVVVPKSEQISGLDEAPTRALKTQLTEIKALL